MTTAEIVLNATDARALTDRIKTGVEAVWELIKQAYTEGAWSALGYESWDDYCTREFGTSRLRLPREERSEVVASLRESGLSLRGIAAATGITHTEVRRSLDAGVTNVPPEPDAKPPGAPTESTPGQTDRVSMALEHAREKQYTPVIGLDGKRYRPQAPKPPAERTIVDQMDAAVIRLGKPQIVHRMDAAVVQLRREVRKIVALTRDPSFSRYREELYAGSHGDLQYLSGKLEAVVSRLTGPVS
jgi:hypothetical protein